MPSTLLLKKKTSENATRTGKSYSYDDSFGFQNGDKLSRALRRDNLQSYAALFGRSAFTIYNSLLESNSLKRLLLGCNYV